MSDSDQQIAIEVFYGAVEGQLLVSLQVKPGTTAAAAVNLSGLLERFPELNQQTLDLGIYGEPCEGSRELAPFDRVEIYRPLLIDPREARRQRVARERGQA